MKIRKSKNVTKEEAQLVKKFVLLCLKEIGRREHEIKMRDKKAPYTLRKATLKELSNMTVHVKARSQRSSGSDDSITIDIMYLRRKITKIWEYKSFAEDSVIGSVEMADPETVLLAVVAHEVAHYVQYRAGPHTYWLRRHFSKPHGQGFRQIYRILRSRIVNPRINA